MVRNALRVVVVVAVAFACIGPFANPPPASANLLDTGCGIIGSIGEGWMGKACQAAAHPKKIVGVVKKVLGVAGKHVLSPSGAVGIAAIVAWAVGGAHFVLSETAKLIGASTSPTLTAAWFSSVYLRVAAVAALLTLPFLCAAAIQAILRSDGALLARAVFAYLPLAFLATGVAAPLAMILLGVTDWMGRTVAQAAGDQGSHFLSAAGAALGTIGVAAGSPFVTFLIATLTAAGGLILWLELLVREAAVYVVVLMLPLVFTAMVWPARRIWATRSVEVLVALILAKFAIVSVLALAASALTHSGGNLVVKSLAGLVLVILGTFAPWALLRLLPLAELASAGAGHVREHAQQRLAADTALGRRGFATVGDGVSSLMSRMNTFHVDATDAASLASLAPISPEVGGPLSADAANLPGRKMPRSANSMTNVRASAAEAPAAEGQRAVGRAPSVAEEPQASGASTPRSESSGERLRPPEDVDLSAPPWREEDDLPAPPAFGDETPSQSPPDTETGEDP